MEWKSRSRHERWGRFLGCSAIAVVSLLLPLVRLSAQSMQPDSAPQLPVEDSLLYSRRLGVAVGYGGTWQNFLFSIFPGSLDCGEFKPIVRREPFVEVFFEAPFLVPSLCLFSYLQYSSHITELNGPPRTQYEMRVQDDLIPVIQQFRYRATRRAVRLALGGSWEPFEGLGLGIAPTITFSPSRVEATTDNIIFPVGAEFVRNGSDVWTVNGATRAEFRPVQFGLDLALRGRLEVGTRLSLHPQVRANFSAGSVASNMDWSEASIGAVLGASVELASPPEPVIPPPPPMPVLTAKIIAKGVDKNGVQYDNPVIEIEEASRVEQVPVIPYIFFDSASAEIPERYILLPGAPAADRFDVDSLTDATPLHIHWQFLNVVGKRMRQRGDVRLTLTGLTSGDEPAADAERIGRARAGAVASYLTDVWGIAPDRITTAYVTNSLTASQEETRQGREENRRVEFHFSNTQLTAPVTIRRLAKIASPPAILFFLDIVADTTLTERFITIEQGERELIRFDDADRGGTLDQQKKWSLSDLRLSRDLVPVRYKLTVRDILGQEATDEGTFTVTERTNRQPNAVSDFEVREFGLVGFKYNSADLLPQHMTQLQEITREFSPASDISIVGFTDSVGTNERNRQLSQSRAKGVYDAIQSIRQRAGQPLLKEASVQGLGRETFNNELPEGRLLARMVRISVIREKTP